MTGYFIQEGNYLMHHGVLGMKWGVRRYQNYDGSLTRAGKARQKYEESKNNLKKANKIGGLKAKYIAGESAERRRNAVDKARAEKDLAKADYKIARGKNEKRAYRKTLKKAGMRGSSLYQKNPTYSKAIYEGIEARKGKDYINKLELNVGVRDFIFGNGTGKRYLTKEGRKGLAFVTTLIGAAEAASYIYKKTNTERVINAFMEG